MLPSVLDLLATQGSGKDDLEFLELFLNTQQGMPFDELAWEDGLKAIEEFEWDAPLEKMSQGQNWKAHFEELAGLGGSAQNSEGNVPISKAPLKEILLEGNTWQERDIEERDLQKDVSATTLDQKQSLSETGREECILRQATTIELPCELNQQEGFSDMDSSTNKEIAKTNPVVEALETSSAIQQPRQESDISSSLEQLQGLLSKLDLGRGIDDVAMISGTPHGHPNGPEYTALSPPGTYIRSKGTPENVEGDHLENGLITPPTTGATAKFVFDSVPLVDFRSIPSSVMAETYSSNKEIQNWRADTLKKDTEPGRDTSLKNHAPDLKTRDDHSSFRAADSDSNSKSSNGLLLLNNTAGGYQDNPLLFDRPDLLLYPNSEIPECSAVPSEKASFAVDLNTRRIQNSSEKVGVKVPMSVGYREPENAESHETMPSKIDYARSSDPESTHVEVDHSKYHPLLLELEQAAGGHSADICGSSAQITPTVAAFKDGKSPPQSIDPQEHDSASVGASEASLPPLSVLLGNSCGETGFEEDTVVSLRSVPSTASLPNLEDAQSPTTNHDEKKISEPDPRTTTGSIAEMSEVFATQREDIQVDENHLLGETARVDKRLVHGFTTEVIDIDDESPSANEGLSLDETFPNAQTHAGSQASLIYEPRLAIPASPTEIYSELPREEEDVKILEAQAPNHSIVSYDRPSSFENQAGSSNNALNVLAEVASQLPLQSGAGGLSNQGLAMKTADTQEVFLQPEVPTFSSREQSILPSEMREPELQMLIPKKRTRPTKSGGSGSGKASSANYQSSASSESEKEGPDKKKPKPNPRLILRIRQRPPSVAGACGQDADEKAENVTEIQAGIEEQVPSGHGTSSLLDAGTIAESAAALEPPLKVPAKSKSEPSQKKQLRLEYETHYGKRHTRADTAHELNRSAKESVAESAKESYDENETMDEAELLEVSARGKYNVTRKARAKPTPRKPATTTRKAPAKPNTISESAAVGKSSTPGGGKNKYGFTPSRGSRGIAQTKKPTSEEVEKVQAEGRRTRRTSAALEEAEKQALVQNNVGLRTRSHMDRKS